MKHIFPDVPINAGCFAPTHIAPPDGTFLYARLEALAASDHRPSIGLNKACARSDNGALVLAGAIIGIIPIFLVGFVIVEFHALNDMIAEADADIGVRLDVARRRGRAAAHSHSRYRAKPVRKIVFVGCSPSDPGPGETLSVAGEGQIDAIGLGFCRTDAHEPAFMRSGDSADGRANKHRHQRG